jgi:diguanylate cyclase (GGDEF)-like protein
MPSTVQQGVTVSHRPIPGSRLALAGLLAIGTAALLHHATQASLPDDQIVAAYAFLAAAYLLALAAIRLACSYAQAHICTDELRDRLARAETDPVTGLPIRWIALDALAGVDRAVALTVAVADIDGFKAINDGPGGHAVGDLYLAEVATRLRQAADDDDTIARLGGDEFILISRRDPAHVAARLTAALAPAVTVAGIDRPIAVSIGICRLPGGDPHQLIGCADLAMYTAKRRRGGIEFYDPARDGVPLPAGVRPAVRPRDRHRDA